MQGVVTKSGPLLRRMKPTFSRYIASENLQHSPRQLSTFAWSAFTVPRHNDQKDVFHSQNFTTLGYMGVLTGIPTYTHDPPIQMNLNSRVILYDGASRLSNAGVHWLIKNDKEKTLSFCPVQSEAATPYLQLCGLTKEDAEHRFLFVEGPGQISEASTAALRVINYLPFPYQIMTIFLAVPEPLRDVVYNHIPRRRCECVGQSDSYILPRKDVVDRFINSSEIRDRYSQQMTL